VGLFSDPICSHTRISDLVTRKDVLGSSLNHSSLGGIQEKTLGTTQQWFIMNVPLSSSSTTGKKLPTIEMCMRELDREKAAQYYKDRDDGRTMVDKSGI
jgi:hypothetical protein